MASRRSSTTTLVLFGLILPACGEESELLPRVSYVEVEPVSVLLAPGDSVRFVARVLDLAGEPVDVPFAWEVEDRSVGLVDSLGWFRARGEGKTRVSVTEIGGVVGFGRATVAAITEMTPRHSAFGGVVTLRGAGFGPGSTVRFGSREGRVQERSADGRTIRAWVPWEADNGPLAVRLADGRVVETLEAFFLTGGGDDALEPNGFDDPTAVPVPFTNPYLAARLTSMDVYRLTLLEPTALTVRVRDRESVNDWQRRLVLQLTREAGVEEFVGVAPAWAFARDERQDAVIARGRVGPGNFELSVFIGPSPLAVDRRYEIEIDTVAEFTLPPDPAEPDDAPFEASTFEAPIRGRFALENPWTADYYAFDVTTRSRVHVEARVPGSAGVFLIDGPESVTWQLANGVRSSTYRGVIAPFGLHGFSCTLDPGRYYVGILENSGNAVEYELEVQVEPTTLEFLNCRTPTLGLGQADGLRAWGTPR